jgi:hypothetical protein
MNSRLLTRATVPAERAVSLLSRQNQTDYWSFEDPAAAAQGDEAQRLSAFRK